jgi:MobA/MobL family
MTTASEQYHARLQAISRGDGRSAVAAAAYRAGGRMVDERYGTTRDFSHKRDVVIAFCFAPEDAPEWARDAERLWNAAEAHETRKNSQVAFEWDIALPAELDDARREIIARNFTDWLAAEYGVAGSVGIHTGKGRGNGLNEHMHVMMTTRSIDEDGFGAKLRQFNVRPGGKNPEVDRVRETIADFINDALEDAGSDTRVDHRSFQERGIAWEPTTHLGPAAARRDREGVYTERGEANRRIIDERMAEQEAALPEITAELERDLANRFGDVEPQTPDAGTQEDGTQEGRNTGAGAPEDEAERLARAVRQGQAVPADAMEHATAGMQPVDADSGEPPILPEPSGWRERMRFIAARAVALWHDETSGGTDTAWRWASRVRDSIAAWWSGPQQDKAEAAADPSPAPPQPGARPAPRADEDSARLPEGAGPEDYSWTLAHEQHTHEHEPGGDQARLLRHTQQPEGPDGAARESQRPRPARPIDAAWERAAGELISAEADASGPSPEEPEPEADNSQEPDEPDME